MAKRLKHATTYAEQVALLESRGLVIDDYDEAIRWLSQINYYRLKGYSFHFQAPNERFKGSRSFLEIVHLHEFDKKLRRILISSLEDIEIYIRTQIAYEFSHSHIQDAYAHYKGENFRDAEHFAEYLTKLDLAMEQNSESIFIQHHIAEYDRKMPLWCIVEVLSFSALSMFYANLRDNDRETIAKRFGVPKETLTNWLHCFSVLRNTCAHYGRLYNTQLSPPARLGGKTLREFPEIKCDTLFAYIICMLRVLPKECQKDTLRNELHGLVSTCIDDIELGLLGFPVSWEKSLFDKRLMQVAKNKGTKIQG